MTTIEMIETWVKDNIPRFEKCRKLLDVYQLHNYITDELKDYKSRGLFVGYEYLYDELITMEYRAYATAYSRILGRSI